MELIAGSRCVVPLRDANGRIIKWFGTNTNIHDQKHAKESLRESEARLNAAMIYAGIGSWEVDLVTVRVTESEQIGPMSGKPAGWCSGDLNSWKALLCSEDHDKIIARLVGTRQRDWLSGRIPRLVERRRHWMLAGG